MIFPAATHVASNSSRRQCPELEDTVVITQFGTSRQPPACTARDTLASDVVRPFAGACTKSVNVTIDTAPMLLAHIHCWKMRVARACVHRTPCHCFNLRPRQRLMSMRCKTVQEPASHDAQNSPPHPRKRRHLMLRACRYKLRDVPSLQRTSHSRAWARPAAHTCPVRCNCNDQTARVWRPR
jgi:hypothetical protein